MSSYSILEFSGFILNVTYFRCLFMSNTSRIALVPAMDFGCVKMSSYSILEFSGFILNVTYFSCLFMSNTSRIAN